MLLRIFRSVALSIQNCNPLLYARIVLTISGEAVILTFAVALSCISKENTSEIIKFLLPQLKQWVSETEVFYEGQTLQDRQPTIQDDRKRKETHQMPEMQDAV